MVEQTADTQNVSSGQDIDALLQDSAKRVEILQHLGTVEFSHLILSGTTGGSVLPTPFGMFPTPSGMFPAPNGTAPFSTSWFPCSPFLTISFQWINPQHQLAAQAASSGETLAPAVTEPAMNNNNLEDAGGDSDNESMADSDFVKCQLGVEESKEFQRVQSKD